MSEIEVLSPKRCVQYQRDGGYRIGHVYGKVTEECEKALVREFTSPTQEARRDT